MRDTIKIKGDKKPCWWVPLSYSTESHPDFDTTTPKYWLSCGYEESTQMIAEIGPESEWIIFNNKMAGKHWSKKHNKVLFITMFSFYVFF